MVNNLSNITGYTGNTLARYNDFVNLALGRSTQQSASIPVFDRIPEILKYTSLRYLVLDRQLAEANDMEIIMSEGPFALVPYRAGVPRVFLAQYPRVVQDQETARNVFFNTEKDRVRFPVVEGNELNLRDRVLTAKEKVEIKSFKRNQIILESVAEEERLLVLNEVYEKGWKAWINNEEAPVYAANYMFRSVVVPSGNARIEFRYDPASYRVGKWGSIICLMVWLGLWGIPLRRSLKKQHP
jgi:hypothetical protein